MIESMILSNNGLEKGLFMITLLATFQKSDMQALFAHLLQVVGAPHVKKDCRANCS